MTNMLVQAKGFDVSRYIGNKANSPTSFALKEPLIAKLPYVEGGVADLYDISIDAADYNGYRLVLRLTRLRKTFYIVNKKRKITKKIDAWCDEPSDGVYPPGFIGLKEVRDKFKQLVAEKEATKDDFENVAQMTIRDYLCKKYQDDRLKTPIKNGKIKPVRLETINGLISVLDHWLDKKICDAKSTWPQDFKDHWMSKPRYNSANWKTTTLSTESMRKYYTYLNAMFNVCVKRGYIAKNQIDGFTYLFERSKTDKIKVYDWDFEEVLSFIYSDEVAEKLSHKLIVATMIVTGARNSEVYMNLSENFNRDERHVYIPGKISKNKNVNRRIPVESEIFWQMCADYIQNHYVPNEHGHMFPSKKASSGHVTDNAYRGVWEAVKSKYNLKKDARLYSNRATYGTHAAKTNSIEIAAELLGDSIETTAKYYLHLNVEAARPSLYKLFNSSKFTKKTEPNPIHTAKASNGNLKKIVQMPDSVALIFKQFLDAKSVVIVDGCVPHECWEQFIEKMHALSVKGLLSNDEEKWQIVYS